MAGNFQGRTPWRVQGLRRGMGFRGSAGKTLGDALGRPIFGGWVGGPLGGVLKRYLPQPLRWPGPGPTPASQGSLGGGPLRTLLSQTCDQRAAEGRRLVREVEAGSATVARLAAENARLREELAARGEGRKPPTVRGNPASQQ